jgi:hypothetical protein
MAGGRGRAGAARAGQTLGYWLYLAHFGLGVLLWGLIFGWWDGLFMLAFRMIKTGVAPLTFRRSLADAGRRGG